MIIMRKFSVRIAPDLCDDVDDLNPEKSYPVLIIKEDDRGETMVMIASDEGRFVWFDIDDEEAFLTSIDE